VLLPGVAGILIAAVCVGGTFMVGTMTGLQEARIRAPLQAPRLIAAMTTAFAIGQIVGPLLVSAVAGARHGIDALLLGVAAALLGTAALLAASPRRASVNPHRG
jgi:hypothetical protein